MHVLASKTARFFVKRQTLVHFLHQKSAWFSVSKRRKTHKRTKNVHVHVPCYSLNAPLDTQSKPVLGVLLLMFSPVLNFAYIQIRGIAE